MGNTATELSQQYGISYKTCLEFRHKVQSVMGHVSPRKLKGDVGIGFFNIYNENDPYFYWLQRKDKRRIAIVIEVAGGKVVQVICRNVDDMKPEIVHQLIEEYVSPTTRITVASGGVRGFKKLEKEYPSLSVIYG